jgi:hypothetical protein
MLSSLLGSPEWCCNFYWFGRLVCSWCSTCCALDKVFIFYFICNYHKCPLSLSFSHTDFKLNYRYFTGHTENPDGTTQFVAGTTGVKQGFMGAIRILTIAVCNLNLISVNLVPRSV